MKPIILFSFFMFFAIKINIVYGQSQLKVDNCSAIFAEIRESKNKINAFEILHFLSPLGDRICEFILWGPNGQDSCLISIYENCDTSTKKNLLAVHAFNNSLQFIASWGNYFDRVWSRNEDSVYFQTRGSDLNETNNMQYYAICVSSNTGLNNSRGKTLPKTLTASSFPNPFSSKVDIIYDIPKESSVNIQIFNLR